MKAAAVIVFATAAMVAVAAQQPPAVTQQTETATVAGRIIAADTGMPIRGAVVRLLSYEVMRLPKSAVSDEQGRYEYSELPAGRYRLDASADGYLGLQFGQRTPTEPGKPIDLRDGERLANADVALPRKSAIEGTVLDEFGDPAPNVRVAVSRVQFVAGNHRLMAVASGRGPRVTDDKGRYRVSDLAPGDYFLSASSGAFSDPNAAGGFAVTYFPGTADAMAATPVRVAVGRDMAGVSFSLVPTRTSQVSGIVVDEAGRPVRGNVNLATSDLGTVTGWSMAGAVSNPDGSFMFRNVPPGNYAVEGFGPPRGGGNLGRSPFGSLKVSVDGSDRTDLTLKVAWGTFARGRITLEKTKTMAEPRPADVRVDFGPVEFDTNPIGGGPSESITNADWTFTVANQFGLRALRVDVRSSDWTIKRATLNGRDVTDTPLDFRKDDVNGLEVVLTDAVSSIGGTVVDENRQPSASYSVVVFAADSTKWKFPSRFIQLARPNQDGRFKTSGLPPESYFAIALPTVQGTEWQDPDFLEKLRIDAVPVTVGEGNARTVELKLARRPD